MVRESDIVCHLVVLYSVDWTKAGISFIDCFITKPLLNVKYTNFIVHQFKNVLNFQKKTSH